MDRRDLKGALFVLAAILAAYVPVLLAGRSLVDNPGLLDISFNFMPNMHWMAHSWSMGEFPLWNPHTFFGMPQLGYSHCGGLYPPNVLLFPALPYPLAGSITIIFHSALAGLLVFVLFRRHGVTAFLGSMASVVFALSGPFFGLSNEFWMLGSTTGALILWLGLNALDRELRFRHFAGAAAGAALCGYSGDTELMVYVLLALGTVFGTDLLLRREDRLPVAAAMFMALALGLALLMPLFLHSLETVRHSVRGPDMPYHLRIITSPEHWPLFLPNLLAPFKYYAEMAGPASFNKGLSPIYMGFLTPWLLVSFMPRALAERKTRGLAISLLALLAYIILKKVGFLVPVFDLIPVVGDLHFEDKASVIAQILSLLIVFTGLSRAASDGKAPVPAGMALLAGGLFTLVFSSASLGGPERIAAGIVAVALGAASFLERPPLWIGTANIVRITALAMAAEASIMGLRHMPRTNPESFRLPPAVAEQAQKLSNKDRFAVFEPLLSQDALAPAQLFGLYEVASGANNIVGPARIPPARSFLYGTLFLNDMAVPFGDEMALASWNMTNPTKLNKGAMHLYNLAGARHIVSRELPVPYSSPYSLLEEHAANWDVVGDMGAGRVIAGPVRVEAPLTVLDGDSLMADLSGDGGWAIIAARADGDIRLLAARKIGQAGRFRETMDLDRHATGAVSLILSVLPEGAKGPATRLNGLAILNRRRPFQLVADEGRDRVFVNRQAMDRAFIARDLIKAADPEEAMEIMRDHRLFDPRTAAVVEQDAPALLLGGGGPDPGDQARIVKYRPGLVEVEASPARPGMLILTDSYFPGWRAFMWEDKAGTELRIEPADLAFRGVRVPRGPKTIVFAYQPYSFRVGLWTAIVTFSGMALFSAASMFRLGMRKRMTKRGGAPPEDCYQETA